jgi:Ca2+-binding EF-hand superfamily protein
MGLDNVLRKIIDGNSLTRPEAEMAFSCFDKNGDGKISKSELESALNKLVKRKADDLGWFLWGATPQWVVDNKKNSARSEFNSADKNGDGLIDWNEFWAAAR